MGFSCSIGLPGYRSVLITSSLTPFASIEACIRVVHFPLACLPWLLSSISLSNAPDVLGLWVGKLEEKLSLYVDNALLYLKNAGPSLLAALLLTPKVFKDQNKLVQINSVPH